MFSKVSPEKKRIRKGSIVRNEVSNNTTIIKICFTGGPCAGKTTAISSIANILRDKGFSTMCVPEAATLIFSSGGILNMETYTVYDGMLFQKALMGLQIYLEKQFVDLIKIKPEGRFAFVLCDRGLLDGSVYVEKKVFDALL
jgi:thymidylate kinase